MEEKNGELGVVISREKSKKSDEKRSFWRVNKALLPYKLHYFLFSGGGGAVYPFHSAFGITVLGLTGSNIGACYTALQVSMFLLKPGIGYIADYFNRLKVLIMGLAVFKTIFCFLLISIPNTGMPGIQLNNNSHGRIYCQLCFNPNELFSGKGYMNEEQFRQISACLKNNSIQSISLHCLTNSSNESLEIRQTTCYKDRALSRMNTALKIDNANEHVFNILYVKKSQVTSVCLSPVPMGKDLNHTYFLSIDVNLFCYDLTNKSVRQLQQILAKSDLKTTNCSDTHQQIVSQPEDERSLTMANFETYQFWVFLICVAMASTLGSSEITTADIACYESNPNTDFGQQRVWSAIGWGLVAPFAGFLNDYTESYLAACFVLACFSALEMWNLSRMNLMKPDFSRNFRKDMKTVLNSVEFLCFGIGILMNGMFTGIIFYYLTWFVVSIGGNKLIVGMVNTVQCFFGEVPAFYVSGWLLKKLGHFNLVSLALIGHGIRFFCYSYLHDPWWILPIECLQGLTYGTFVTALTSYGKLNAKPGTEATMQSILAIIFDSLGCGIGCVVTGVCLEYFGGHATFFYASCFCVFATMINILSTLIVGYRGGSQDVSKSPESAERY